MFYGVCAVFASDPRPDGGNAIVEVTRTVNFLSPLALPPSARVSVADARG